MNIIHSCPEKNAPISWVTVEPPNTATSCVIWLHGLSDTAYGILPMYEHLKFAKKETTRFVFPHAPKIPLTIERGQMMRGWFDITDMSLIEHPDIVGLEGSISHIHFVINAQRQQGIPASNIIIAGFSQGGVMALYSGLSFSKKLGGILAVSSYLPENRLPKTCHLSNQNTPIQLYHGNNDPIVPIGLGKRVSQELQGARYPVSWNSYAMGHWVCYELIDDFDHWLAQRLEACDDST